MKDEEMSGKHIIVEEGAMSVCRICRDFFARIRHTSTWCYHCENAYCSEHGIYLKVHKCIICQPPSEYHETPQGWEYKI